MEGQSLDPRPALLQPHPQLEPLESSHSVMATGEEDQGLRAGLSWGPYELGTGLDLGQGTCPG